jgi:hypothetical protein
MSTKSCNGHSGSPTLPPSFSSHRTLDTMTALSVSLPLSLHRTTPTSPRSPVFHLHSQSWADDVESQGHSLLLPFLDQLLMRYYQQEHLLRGQRR